MEADLSTLRAHLLDSLFDEAALEPALTQFAALCDAPVAQLMVADGAVINGHRALLRSAFSNELDDALTGKEHDYQHINPRVLAIPKMKVGHAIRDKDFISWDEIHKDQTYQELIIPAGLGHGSLVPMLQSSSLIAGVALHRPISANPFSDREAEVHQHVSRVCASVFELADKITNRHQKSVLNMFGSHRAVALFDRAGLLIDHNDAYENLCRERASYPQRGARPGIVSSHAMNAWRNAIRLRSGTVQISRPDEIDSYLFCTVLPTPRVGQHLYSSEKVIALFREELRLEEIDVLGFQADFFLTSAESETALLIACGRSVQEVSVRRGVSVETTRTLLKRALHKVGKRGQPELVRLVCEYRYV